MRKFRYSEQLSILHNARELIIVRHLPADHDGVAHWSGTKSARHTQTRPQHHRVKCRRAAGHTQRKRIAGNAGLAPQAARQTKVGGARGRKLEQLTANLQLRGLHKFAYWYDVRDSNSRPTD